MHARKRNQGFTLIELLVVVSIVMILIAILLPMLTKSKDAGQLAQCVSNLRQMGMAMQSWQTGHKMRYTPGDLNGVSGDNKSEFLWGGKKGLGALAAVDSDIRYLNPFIGGPFAIGDEVPLAQCPKDPGLYQTFSGCSYGSNHRRGFDTLVLADGISPISAAVIETPENFVMASEYGAILAAYNDVSLNGSYAIRWHWGTQNRWNLLFADIHVDAVSLQWGTMSDSDIYNFEYK